MAKKNLNRAVSGVLSTTDSSHVRKVKPADIKKRELAQQFSQDSPFQRQMQTATQAKRQ